MTIFHSPNRKDITYYTVIWGTSHSHRQQAQNWVRFGHVVFQEMQPGRYIYRHTYTVTAIFILYCKLPINKTRDICISTIINQLLQLINSPTKQEEKPASKYQLHLTQRRCCFQQNSQHYPCIARTVRLSIHLTLKNYHSSKVSKTSISWRWKLIILEKNCPRSRSDRSH